MAWFKVDDGFYDHPKVEELPNAAVGLWVKAGTWCAKHETDGVIPATRVKAFKGTASQTRALIECGLWSQTTTNSGAKAYSFRDWFDYQPSREEREEERQIWREKKKRERERKLDQVRNGRGLSAEVESNRVRNEHGLGTNPNANATQNESDLDSNATQNEFKSRSQNPTNQHEHKKVPRGVTQMSPEGTNEGVTQMSGTIPGPSRPDPSYIGTTSQPSNGEYGDGQELAGPTLNDLADATRRARQAGISDTAITAGTRRFNERPEPKGPGLLRTLINDEWEAEQLKTRIETDRQQKRDAITNCTLCDQNGMRDTGNGLTRCKHQPPLKAVGGPY